MSPTAANPSWSCIAIDRLPTTAARTTAFCCPTGTCSSCSMRQCSTTWRWPQVHLDVRHPGALESDQHIDPPDTVGGGLCEEGRSFRSAQRSREPSREFCELGTHRCDAPECRRAGPRHPRPVLSGRGLSVRPAGSSADGRSSPRSTAGDPVMRCLRRCQWHRLQQRLQRRALHPRVQPETKDLLEYWLTQPIFLYCE